MIPFDKMPNHFPSSLVKWEVVELICSNSIMGLEGTSCNSRWSFTCLSFVLLSNSSWEVNEIRHNSLKLPMIVCGCGPISGMIYRQNTSEIEAGSVSQSLILWPGLICARCKIKSDASSTCFRRLIFGFSTCCFTKSLSIVFCTPHGLRRTLR